MSIELRLDGEASWPDVEQLLADGKLVEGGAPKFALLKKGVTPQVLLRVALPNGVVVTSKITLKSLVTAAQTMSYVASNQAPRTLNVTETVTVED